MAIKLKEFVEEYLSESDRSRDGFRVVDNAMEQTAVREPQVWDVIPIWCAARERLALSVDLYDVEQAVLRYQGQQHGNALRH